MSKKKLIFFSSSLFNINLFLSDLIISLKDNFDIYIVSYSSPNDAKISGVNYININFYRKISILYDFKAFIKFFFIIYKVKPNLIFTITPKISFIVSLVKIFFNLNKIHFFTGQIWYNKKGIKKFLFKIIDLFIQNTSKLCFVDSNTQLNFLIENKFNVKKIKLIFNGSISGVDTSKYTSNDDLKINFKKKYNIGNDFSILLFLGRVTQDKGIYDLLSLYERLLNDNLKIKLVIAGLDEEKILDKISINNKQLSENLIYLGHINYPEKILPIADVFILLSKREGFGLSIIEASSCSVPIIANNIVGLRDSVSNNKTGILIDNFKNVDDYNKIKNLMTNPDLRKKFGINGRLYVEKYFEKKEVIRYLSEEIKRFL